jgi:glucosamine--fructose-6-phosphate aminotransferase (isomerizing)
MCGITARVGQDNALTELLAGLENLEYRGYDSAGVAVANGTGISVVKREGKIERLTQRLEAEGQPEGAIGLGHTRWSTHGPPSDRNAHPHTDCGDRVAVVHNGIIENHDALRTELRAAGHELSSDTDTEVVPHLVEQYLAEGADPEAAFRSAIDRLDGSYALAMLVEGRDAIFATRQDSPLVLGVADDTYYLASDVPAFLEFTDSVIFLEDGEVAVVERDGYHVTGLDGQSLDRQPRTVDWTPDEVQKGRFDHFMLKEIHEQPTSLAQTVRGRIDAAADAVELDTFPPGSLDDVTDVHFVGCGTSYHAAMYARPLYLSQGIQAQVTRAGEFANGDVPMRDGTLVVGVTQSGETADTLAALRQARADGARTLALTNTVGSTAARECDDALFIRAGPEIGVAATKTFSSQVATLALLGHRIAADRGADPDMPLDALEALPEFVDQVLEGTSAADLAARHLDRDTYFFIGRGIAHPVALEGALKFKEISYEHAEGFSSSQLKHGPLALVTPDTTVIAVFTGRHDRKTLSNVREVQARGATVVAVASETDDEIAAIANEVVPIPETPPEVAGVLANVQLQLISYHVANRLGRSIDKPRNLAKSVTVE